MPKTPLLEKLKREILVTDGATGTRFYEKGLPPHQCYEHLNLTDAGMVLELHREYIDAGAQIIQTNTFSANPSKLADFKLAGKVHEINLAGAKIARRAAGSGVYVSGSMGPLLHPADPSQAFTEDEKFDMFKRQARGLHFGGVDFITLETFSNLEDLKLAFEAVGEIAPDMLIIPQAAFVTVARTSKGESLKRFVQLCHRLGAKAIGANCGMGPHHLKDIVLYLAERTELPIIAVPNAGYPEYHEGRIHYHTGPDYMGKCAVDLVNGGANIIGGCCGTTPAHIREMAKAVKGLKPALRRAPLPPDAKKSEIITLAAPKHKWNLLKDVGKRLLWTVEIDPPAGLDISKVIKGAGIFKDCGIDAVNISENPLGRSRMSSTVLGNMIQEQFDLPAIVHITGRDRNVIGLQSELLGAAQCNIASILAITGDPTSAGDYPWAKSVFDVNSFGLVELISKLNRGVNLAGHSIGRPTEYSIGVAFNATRQRIDNEIKRLERKAAAGAHFAQTQPIYEKDKIVEIADKTAHIGIPVFIGILTVVSYRNAEFLHNEFPGIYIPENIREALRKCNGDKKEEEKVSLDMMTEMMLEVSGIVPGFYCIPQFNRFKLVRRLIENVRGK
ncbi:bifunctional homocysteine S-methyltransferase/methylenetetrahydrofolate reductase [Planctomycetota bacterium]